MFISVISPVYKAEGIVSRLVERLVAVLEPISADYEIILVEDHSPDKSWEEIQAACKQNSKVKGFKLSRNFGQHNAISAGLDHSSGEWVVVMDCDLQDKPEEISRLLEHAQAGDHEIVLASRKFRKDSWLKRMSSYLFYNVLEYLTGIEQDREIANFGIYSRKVIDVIVKDMRESIRYFPMMIRWLGFKPAKLEVDHGTGERASSYSFRSLLHLAFNVMLTFSDKPLRLTIRFGLMIIFGSALFALFTIYRYYTDDITQEGWASLIVSIWFLGGLIIFTLGVVGLYLGKTFAEVKRRPIYVIEEKENIG